MTCCQCQGAESVFSGWYVRRELRRYRRSGPRPTTRILIDALKAEGADGATILDIGGGIGALHHGLLEAGATRATEAEAATAYLEAASDEAKRQGHAGRVDYRHGDFVSLANELEPAEIVALDRVICCYPDMDALVTLSVGKARRLYGLVYPRDVWWTKMGHRFLNFLLRLTGNPFRVFVHPTRSVDALVRGAGFRRLFQHDTMSWQVVVYGRETS